ncbi:hypothetical protein HETIRDRAFT_105793 [Heterobasidion irregulare TC 32-1]|uniref:Anaphase-promoting complex subunit 5 n=1 Tax=Heterobasidion irregulare (strain TC 32-1) TaxID=747525 RepID=W4JRY1_HETIT|nr:uncharacterized protein HETIRDRAFT_105793 [Heterobasidion irregulare TC 32-1]ETW76288.1 hypothetical protein HETIRDRAFT_105793 [Heterobasidion irregulare TC 32-1]
MLQWYVNEHQTYLERKLGSFFDSLEMVDSDTLHATTDYYHSPDSVYYHKRGSSEFDEEDAVRDALDLLRSLRSTKSDMTTAQVARRSWNDEFRMCGNRLLRQDTSAPLRGLCHRNLDLDLVQLYVTQEVAILLRPFRQARPDRHSQDFALNLSRVYTLSIDLGRQQEGHDWLVEAAEVYTFLAESTPETYGVDLAKVLNQLAVSYANDRADNKL